MITFSPMDLAMIESYREPEYVGEPRPATDKYVGVSLSFCVKAILQNQVHPDQIAFIVPNFNWDRAGRKPDESYYSIYWQGYSRSTIDSLLETLIFHPRPADTETANISKGLWIPEAEFSWESYADPLKRLPTEAIPPYKPKFRHTEPYRREDEATE